MTRLTFKQRLQQKTPILADGGTGILLADRSESPLETTCMDALNLQSPDLVQSIHADYLQAGAELLETNTFGANRQKLADYGLADQVRAINQAGVRILQAAITASGRKDVYIAGSVGPLGLIIKPYGTVPLETARDIFREQISALIDAGVDVILLESFIDHKEILLALNVCQTLDADMPVIAQTTFTDSKTDYTGYTASRIALDLDRAGATVIGVNCGSGPRLTLDVVAIMQRALPDKPLSTMPNAGFPQSVDGRRFVYSASPDYFKTYAQEAWSQGAQVIGGCCGTTPAHIAAMREGLSNLPEAMSRIDVVDPEEDIERISLAPTHLEERLKRGDFTITVEMTPPRSFTPERFLKQARMLRDTGAHLIDVADTPAARMKMSAWAVSHLIQDTLGIETVLHFPTRGRNILRVQGDLLAAHTLGLRTLFVTMGDPARIGDYPEAMDSYDIVPSKLIGLIKQEMNEGRDMAGNSIGMPTRFTVGCALNMGADNLEREVRVLGKKLASGADFALGQAVFNPPKLDAFHQYYEQTTGEAFKLPVLMGVIVLYSLRQAQFLHDKVPGIIIPDHIFKRLEDAGDDAAQEGIKIAIELITQMRDRVQGAYIIPSYGRYSLAAQVIDAVV